MAGFALKIKSKSGQSVVKNLSPVSTVNDLKKELTGLGTTNIDSIQIRAGFPPKPIDLSNAEATLQSLQINSGDTLIIEETTPNNQENTTEKGDKTPAARPHTTDSNLSCPGILIRKPVPADNSCLFTSFGFVLSGKHFVKPDSY